MKLNKRTPFGIRVLLAVLPSLFLNANFASAAAVPLHFERRFNLTGSGCSDVQWTADIEEGEITIAWTSSPGAEWTAFGISPNGGMHGADIVTVQHSINGEGFEIHDRYSVKKEKPVRDLLQSYKLVHVEEDEDERIHAVVKRKLKTCDRQDMDVEFYKQYLICASGDLDANGDITYHGELKSKGLVNLLVDEELLLSKQFERPEPGFQEKIAPGIVARASYNQSEDAFVPVDIQMNSVNVSKTGTSKYCQVFHNPAPMRYAAFETVHSTAGIDSPSTGTPDFIRHVRMAKVLNEQMFGDILQSGKPFDCDDTIMGHPILTSTYGSARIQTPPNVDLMVDEGYFFLEVRFDNTEPVEQAHPGIRLWTRSPSKEHSSKIGQISVADAAFDSIFIPADPEEKEVYRSFLISSEYTKAKLPETGVQVFRNFVHMHSRGVRGHVQVIRDGVNILDPVDTTSYDVDTQAANFKSWRFLPGDALVITCTYKAHPTQDIVGGPSSANEMCLYAYGMAPAVPDFGIAIGKAVAPGEDYQPTFATNKRSSIDTNDPSFDAVPTRPDFELLMNHRYNLCNIAFRDAVDAPNFAFSEPGVPVQIAMIVAVFFCVALSWRKTKMGSETKALRETRNNIVYIGEILFSSVALPIFAIALAEICTQYSTGSLNVYEPETYTLVRGLGNIQSALYLMELVYRIDPAPSLICHHLVTSSLLIFFNYSFNSGAVYISVLLALLLILFALTEQPVYLLLLMRNYKFHEKYPKSWPKMCYASIVIFLATRFIIIAYGCFWLVTAFNENSLDWQIGEVSLASWRDPSDQISSVLFGSVVATGMVLLMVSNVFVVMAIKHISKTKPKSSLPSSQSPSNEKSCPMHLKESYFSGFDGVGKDAFDKSDRTNAMESGRTAEVSGHDDSI